MRHTSRSLFRTSTIVALAAIARAGWAREAPVPVPAPAVTPEAAEAPAPGEASTAWLGVFVGDAIDGGVQLVAVVAGGPAQKAGLRAGDLLLRLDGSPVPDRDAIEVLTSRLRPGSRVPAEILREGRHQTRWLEPVAHAGPAWSQLVAPDSASGDLGAALSATVVAIPDMLRVHYGAPADRGALVAKLDGAGPAAAAGMRVGDVILAVDGVPVRDPIAYRVGSASAPRRVELIRDGARREIELPAPPTTAPAAGPGRSEEIRALHSEIDRLAAKVKDLERQLELERSRRMK